MLPYVNDLGEMSVDMGVIRANRPEAGRRPAWAARRLHYWEPINDVYGGSMSTVVKQEGFDPTFSIS